MWGAKGKAGGRGACALGAFVEGLEGWAVGAAEVAGLLALKGARVAGDLSAVAAEATWAVEPPGAVRRTKAARRVRAARVVGPGRAAEPMEGPGEAWMMRRAEAVRDAWWKGGVGGGARGCLDNCGWQVWSRLEDERSTPQVGQ
jgi:hypothetical protein